MNSFSKVNLQSLQVGNSWGLIKLSTIWLYFNDSNLHRAMLIKEMGMCKREAYFILKICMSLKVLELTGWCKSLQQKDRIPLWIFE